MVAYVSRHSIYCIYKVSRANIRFVALAQVMLRRPRDKKVVLQREIPTVLQSRTIVLPMEQVWPVTS